MGTKHSNPTDRTKAIKKAVDKAGGVVLVASEFNLSERAVRKWWQVGIVPSSRVYRLSEMGGFGVKPHELNPSVYPASLCV